MKIQKFSTISLEEVDQILEDYITQKKKRMIITINGYAESGEISMGEMTLISVETFQVFTNL